MNRSMAAMGVLLSVLLTAAHGSTPAGLWLETASKGERNPALLIATDVHMEVTGLLVETRVTQHFLNTTDQFAEGRYVFPLPDDTAVETLDIIIGERHVAGEIRERGQARQQYRQARDSGRAAGLVEREHGNLFVTRVANIPPGERVEIRIGYRQRVDYAHGRYRLRFPTTAVPRFGHSLAAAHAMSDADGRHPDDHSNANPNTFRSSPFQLSVDLAPGMPLAGIESSHHDIRTERVNGRWRVDLHDEVVDSRRDFELEWTPADTGAVEATAFAEQHLGKEHLLLMLTPPQVFDAVDTPREVILIIDTSGSMQGEPMEQARESLIFALASLGSEDRFNVIEFDHRTRALHDAPVVANRANLLAAKRWVERLNAGGGTVMGPSLAMAMRDAVPVGYLRQIVFVTDGLIANEREVLEQIEADIGDSRLFTVGIGHGVNSAFLRQASDMGRGTHTLIGELDQINRRMSELILQLESPVLHDIRLDWPGGAEVYPARQRDLYIGEPLMVSARLDALAGDLVVRGTSAGQPWRKIVALEDFLPGNGVAAHWGRLRIGELEHRRSSSAGPDDVTNDMDEQVLHTALDYGLVSSRTSLVAVDRTPLRSRADALAAHNVSAGPAHGRDMQLRAMPSTDGGSSSAVVRGMVALLLVFLLFAYRQPKGDDGEQS